MWDGNVPGSHAVMLVDGALDLHGPLAFDLTEMANEFPLALDVEDHR